MKVFIRYVYQDYCRLGGGYLGQYTKSDIIECDELDIGKIRDSINTPYHRVKDILSINRV